MASYKVQRFQEKINKFNNIKLVNHWIKYKLDTEFENHLWQIQAEIQLMLVMSPPHNPQFFLTSVLTIYKKDLCEE